MEPWQRVLVSADEFTATVHGEINCEGCHQGRQSDDKATAHTGLVARPGENFTQNCAGCHAEITSDFQQSLHFTQAGFWPALNARSGGADQPELQTMFANHCANCHTSCGDCHVSQPVSVGGGLIDGHVFTASPTLRRSCTACHGSRIGDEYLGLNGGIPADVHYRNAQMGCIDCHDEDEMHSLEDTCFVCHDGVLLPEVEPTGTRYDGPEQVSCTDCHPEVPAGENGNVMHIQHGSDLQCQVCHSVMYSNCTGCHVTLCETTGEPIYHIDEVNLSFTIGKNPIRNLHRPYQFVVLRHIPTLPDSFSFYTGEVLTDYSVLPTWKYATPHNIQLDTPQNASCDACHGNPAFFLTADRIDAGELEANQAVIVDEVPPSVTSP